MSEDAGLSRLFGRTLLYQLEGLIGKWTTGRAKSEAPWTRLAHSGRESCEEETLGALTPALSQRAREQEQCRLAPAVAKLADDHRCVVAAETEAVRHGCRQAALAGFVGRVVQVAGRVGFVQIDRRWDHAVAEREHCEHEFHSAAGAQQVAELAFGAGDAEAMSVVAEDSLDRDRFGLIAQRRAGAVRVDVANVAGVELGVAQGGLHRPSGATSFGVGLGNVAGVGTGAIAE